MSLALPMHPEQGPPAVDWQGNPIRCEDCPCHRAEARAQCEPRHACVQDRYALRISRFFTWNPRLADNWLTHPYFEVRAIAARHANLFRISVLLNDPDETVRASVAMRVPQTLLRRLVHDPHREVRVRVAQRLVPRSLVAMLKDPDYYVRVWVARRIPHTFLARMSEDTESEVRMEVAERLSPGALVMLAR
ncbi:MAG TPA: 4Fe4S-binding leucine-rich repeat protein, partial [Polyangiaceae bacterium]|nr:4Fe4S-binding leucine-rich repeat protein [Polyangiaceae bacterium]